MDRNQLGGQARPRAGLFAFLSLDFFLPPVDKPRLDLSVLEDRTLYSATPLLLGAEEVATTEDAPDLEVDLRQYFQVDDSGGPVQYAVLQNDQPTLFDNVSVDNQGHLVLGLADDAHGLANLSIRATNAVGQSELLPLHVEVEAINDAPTAINLQSVTVTNLQAGRTVIDLFAAFDDLEDADEDLDFRVVGNTNPGLFSSIEFDEAQGLLILHHAAGHSGTAELTIEATDTGNLSVGSGTADEFFVFDRTAVLGGGQMGTIDDIGLSELSLWTSWYFFDLQSDGYSFDELEVEKFVRYLESVPADQADLPIVFDIENDQYVNTPEGRDRFAEVFAIANELRPDLNISLYRYMPERNWWGPMNWARSQEDLERGLNTGFVTNAAKHEQAFNDWLERNEYYRTENVDAEFGGVPLADMVDAVNPSLYTFYRNLGMEPYWRHADFDGVANTFTIDGPSFDTVEIVRVKMTTGTVLPNELKLWTDYHVVNVQGDTFQLSATAGGPAIDFGDTFTGEIYLGAVGPTWENMWHDPSVIYWEDYAEANIAEARKFDKPVYAWLSPSFKGTGNDYLEADFFRWQLEVLRPLVDGIVIYDMGTQSADFHQSQGWWTALDEFMQTLDTPASTVSISIPAAVTNSVAPPTAVSDSLSTVEDRSVTFNPHNLLNNDRDPQGRPLTISLSDQPDHGSLEVLADGNWRYTPGANFHGQDTFAYRAYNGTAYSNQATVTLNVSRVNDAPVAVNDQYSLMEDSTLTLAVSQLLQNDHDADSNSLTFSLGTGPQNGTLSRNADGTLFYRPAANFVGTDQFTYRVHDGQSDSVQAATVVLNVAAVNDRPIAVADRFAVVQGQTLTLTDTQLMANDRDAERDPLRVEIVSRPANGTLVKQADGSYQYVANARFRGEDEFMYRVSDGKLNSLVTVVAVDVEGNGLPQGVDDKFSTREDAPLVLRPEQLLANDGEIDASRFRIELVDEAQHGTVRREANGAIVYTPAANFNGLDRFGYRITDGTGNSDVVAVQVNVAPVNDSPFARADLFRVKAGSTLKIGGAGVLANDSDLDGDQLRARLLSAPTSGSLSLATDGSFEYRPRAGFVGTDTFQYRVLDERGAASVAQATIRVESAVRMTTAPSLESLAASPARAFVLHDSQVPIVTRFPRPSTESDEDQDGLLPVVPSV